MPISEPAVAGALDREPALDRGLGRCDLPELGPVYRGKVRDCYTVAGRRILVATDRISAFDRVFPETIPYKGQILNLLAAHFLRHAAAIAPVHLLDVPDPNVTVARELAGCPVEVVVRGYLAGSAWRDYQEGVFAARYGFDLPADLGPNARLAEPIVTPTDKRRDGHDRPLTADEAAALVGGERAWGTIRATALALFEQGTRLAAERGLILADTKYEFGRESGELFVMDEIHTPDSSRYWYRESYEADPRRPDQLSKEVLRDWLRERGFTGDGPLPALPDELRLDIARRYLELYRLLTGAELVLDREAERPAERICRNLAAAGLMRGAFVAILLGSPSDREVAARVIAALGELGIPAREWVVSAHKVPDKLYGLVRELNASAQPLAIVAIAGRSNGLAGCAAASSVHPVIALPAFADRADYQINIHSSLQMPSETPAVTCIDPANAALAAARMLALADAGLRARIETRIDRTRDGFLV